MLLLHLKLKVTYLFLNKFFSCPLSQVPKFANTSVNFQGNADIGGGPSSRSGKGSKTGKIVGVVIGSVFVLLFLGLLAFCFVRRKKLYQRVQHPNRVAIHPNHSGSDDAVKITVTNMVMSIQVLRAATNDFSDDQSLDKGGFGTVYKGELHDGTKIAVKRMNSEGGQGLGEFQSEIAVLTKVRHRHLVGLLGYCLDGNEKILVHEYLPQGALIKHLFSWKREELKPLEWKQRLTIALDIAKGVEYLHSLAHQSFIHKDLKPCNILLGDDMRAKVADFELVPDGGKTSIETSRLAGTFGYLAPEYAGIGEATICTLPQGGSVPLLKCDFDI